MYCPSLDYSRWKHKLSINTLHKIWHTWDHSPPQSVPLVNGKAHTNNRALKPFDSEMLTIFCFKTVGGVDTETHKQINTKIGSTLYAGRVKAGFLSFATSDQKSQSYTISQWRRGGGHQTQKQADIVTYRFWKLWLLQLCHQRGLKISVIRFCLH